MIKWTKYGKRIDAEGTTIFYKGNGTNLTIDSRKRHIPHANGIGTWDHTSYWVLRDGAEIAEKQSLGDAKQYAEVLHGAGAMAKITVDRLPEAPEPTKAYREQEKIGIGVLIDHDYRVRMAKKRRNDRRA